MIMQTGFLTEVFSSWQGEGGSVLGSCFGKRQIFIRFAGCNLALGDFGTKGCIWCDSPSSKGRTTEPISIEQVPGMRNFTKIPNPVNCTQVLQVVRDLTTKDLHSISFTGGEPLLQEIFVIEMAECLRENGYSLYLETNGTLPPDNVIQIFDFCCGDIKDRTANAAKIWEQLAEKEILFLAQFARAHKSCFGKVVISAETNPSDIQWICNYIDRNLTYQERFPVAIQLVTPLGKESKAPPWTLVEKCCGIAMECLGKQNVSISVQLHKVVGIL
jgi:7-carboxy-7-deazaguanine synthase